MNALSLYVTTCRMVLQSGADDASAWADISRLLSCLRQSLLCCVCEKILTIPTSSSVSNCRHNVCKRCIGGKILLNSPCESCSDFSKFTENTQVRLIIQCYKKLCEYISCSSLHQKWSNMNGGTMSSLAEIVQEGCLLQGEHRSTSTHRNMGTVNLRSAITNHSPCNKNSTNERDDGVANKDYPVNGNRSEYSVMVNDNGPTKIMIKRTPNEGIKSEGSTHTSMESTLNSLYLSNSTVTTETVKSSRPKRRGCRCGLATRNPGQLTCCGQRCLCYVDRRACNQCRCRGCRNPNKYLANSGVIPQTSGHETSKIDFYIESTVEINGNNEC